MTSAVDGSSDVGVDVDVPRCRVVPVGGGRGAVVRDVPTPQDDGALDERGEVTELVQDDDDGRARPDEAREGPRKGLLAR